MKDDPEAPVLVACSSPVEVDLIANLLAQEHIPLQARPPAAWAERMSINLFVPKRSAQRAQELILNLRLGDVAPRPLQECPSCRYDLRGARDATRCSECGLDLPAAQRQALLFETGVPAEAHHPGSAISRVSAASLIALGLIMLIGCAAIMTSKPGPILIGAGIGQGAFGTLLVIWGFLSLRRG